MGNRELRLIADDKEALEEMIKHIYGKRCWITDDLRIIDADTGQKVHGHVIINYEVYGGRWEATIWREVDQ